MQVARFTDRSKSYIITKAIQNYVMELQEDLEDYLEAEKLLTENNPSIPIEEVIKKLGLEKEIGLRNAWTRVSHSLKRC